MRAIKKCKEIRKMNIKYDNPYGDGKSSERIVSLIKSLDLSPKLFKKKLPIKVEKIIITGGSGTVGESFISKNISKYEIYSYSRK